MRAFTAGQLMMPTVFARLFFSGHDPLDAQMMTLAAHAEPWWTVLFLDSTEHTLAHQSKQAELTLIVVIEWMDPSCDYIGGLVTTGQCRISIMSDASLPRFRTCAFLSPDELAFYSTFQRSTEKGKRGPQINGDLLCSVQCAACRVQVCVRARPSPLPSRMRTDELRQTGVDQPASLQQVPPRPLPGLPHLRDLDAGQRQRAGDHLGQFLFLSMCCMLRCGSSCPSPCHPLALVPRSGGIRRQNVVA